MQSENFLKLQVAAGIGPVKKFTNKKCVSRRGSHWAGKSFGRGKSAETQSCLQACAQSQHFKALSPSTRYYYYCYPPQVHHSHGYRSYRGRQRCHPQINGVTLMVWYDSRQSPSPHRQDVGHRFALAIATASTAVTLGPKQHSRQRRLSTTLQTTIVMTSEHAILSLALLDCSAGVCGGGWLDCRSSRWAGILCVVKFHAGVDTSSSNC